jgi:hypothetical protein
MPSVLERHVQSQNFLQVRWTIKDSARRLLDANATIKRSHSLSEKGLATQYRYDVLHTPLPDDRPRDCLM